MLCERFFKDPGFELKFCICVKQEDLELMCNVHYVMSAKLSFIAWSPVQIDLNSVACCWFHSSAEFRDIFQNSEHGMNLRRPRKIAGRISQFCIALWFLFFTWCSLTLPLASDLSAHAAAFLDFRRQCHWEKAGVPRVASGNVSIHLVQKKVVYFVFKRNFTTTGSIFLQFSVTITE